MHAAAAVFDHHKDVGLTIAARSLSRAQAGLPGDASLDGSASPAERVMAAAGG